MNKKGNNLNIPTVMIEYSEFKGFLVGGFNPFEKY